MLASYGHVRDLVPKEGAVDPDRHFAMNYEVIDRNEKHVDAIAKAAKTAEALYLATDLDREGEAISWHIAEILKARGLLDGRDLHRVVFSEITPRAIKEAVAHPRKLSMDLVNAQQGAARARLPGRLQPVAGAVAQGAARPLRRPRAVAGAAHDRRARGRDRSVQGTRVLDDRSRLRASGPGLQGAPDPAARQEVRAVRPDQRDRRARRARGAAALGAGAPGRRQRRVEGAQAPSVAPVHHLDAAAGSRAQARLLDQPHDEDRAGPVRRRRPRRRGRGRPDHLHAYRRGLAVDGRDRRAARRHRPRLRRTRAARAAAFLPQQVQERAGSARGDPSDLGAAPAQGHRPLPQRRAAQAVRADLEARAGQPDAARDAEHGVGRSRRRRRFDVPRQRHDGGRSGLPRRLRGRPRREERRRRGRGAQAAGDDDRRGRAARRDRGRPALHRAAAALFRKPRWSRRSRNTASAARRPTPASSRCCSTANT